MADSPLLIAAEALTRAHEANLGRWIPAIEACKGANTIWAAGVGKSGFVAKKFAASATSFGVPAQFLHPVEALHGDAGTVRPDDVLLAVSASGRTPELVRLSRDLGVPVVAICPDGSPLAAVATACLNAAVVVEAGGDAPSTSFLVASALADALALALRPAGRLHHPGGSIALTRRTVAEVMLSPPMVSRSATLAECIPCLQHGAVFLAGGGIFTDGDLRRAVGTSPAALSEPVSAYATPHPVTVGPNDSLALALDRMERRSSQLSVLPVASADGEYVGLVRLHDLVRAGMGA